MKDYISGISAAFISVTTLFFAWGFITSNNDPLIASLKASPVMRRERLQK